MKAVKVWTHADYKGTEKYHPVDYDDIWSKNKLIVTIMTLKSAKEDEKKAYPCIRKCKDGFYEMILKVKELKEKDIQKYMDILTFFTGVRYNFVGQNLDFLNKPVKQKYRTSPF